jgi:tRNA-2-methylthio-N6-dimethylallyladenosine synthase
MTDRNQIEVSPEKIDRQWEYIHQLSHLVSQKAAAKGRPMRAYTDTYGCQQNVADTQSIAGMLVEMGYELVEEPTDADIIVINTCAVREHAEQRVLGNVGQMSHLKKKNPDLILAICGCMVQQAQVAEKIRRSYPYVDMVFGTHMVWRFPELLYRKMTGEKRVFDISGEDHGEIAEGLPIQRDGQVHAFLSIMYGCNNFCTYCIVPYVRGRERSRTPESVEAEFRRLLSQGYRDITLLGQNVNSYGKDLAEPVDFSDLLRRLNAIEGDFIIRFMTSHPKDASHRLLDTMAECEKVAKQLHLPFQCGSDRILKNMNRHYDRAQYLELIDYARQKMPDIVLTSDVIVGFPGETEEDFEETISLIRRVRFHSLFTFIYSKRTGTPAAEMPDPISKEEKQRWFQRLLDVQAKIGMEEQQAYLGRTVEVLIDGHSKYGEFSLTGRTNGNVLVCCRGEGLEIGKKAKVKIVDCGFKSLFGEVKEAEGA